MSISTNKRIAIVLGAALVALACASPALAAWGNSSYLDWDDVSGLPGQGTSPHGGYSTNTLKCGVCHSVHQADPDGEALLLSSVADACTYCHVSPATSTRIVYNGDPGNYSGTDFENAHNYYSGQGVECADCHQVHAADSLMTVNSYLTTKILQGPKDNSSFDYDPRAGAPLTTDSQHTALSKWCTYCHFASYGYYGQGYNDDTHLLATATASYGNPAASYSGRVAWIGSNYCSSCHASEYGTSAWPHFTKGARFLVSAEGSSTVATGTIDPNADGVCLRCHRDGLGNGIGLSF